MRTLGLGLLCLAMTGCITTHATLVDPTATRYARVPPDSVRIFTDPSELDTLDFVRIAIIEASGSGEWTNQSEMLQAMRTKAGELGGNGVILPTIEEPSAGAKVAAAIFGTGTQRKGNVVAVRVLGVKKNHFPPERGTLMRTLLLIVSLSLVAAAPANAQRRPASFLSHAAPSPMQQIRFESREPLARFLSADCDLDRTRGREAADQLHSGSGWMAGGFASGVLLGLIGTAITYAMANSSSVEVNRVPDGVEPSCYRDGYVSKAKSKNTSNALTGGLLGTALLVVLVVSATNGSTY